MHPSEGSAKECREMRQLPRTHPGHGQKRLAQRDPSAAGTNLPGAAHTQMLWALPRLVSLETGCLSETTVAMAS